MSSRTVRSAVLAMVLTLAGVLAVVLSSAPAEAAYPGGDGRIAFVRHSQIFTMTSSGKDVTKLTRKGVNSHPKWSPDGLRISFIRQIDGRTDVWVMNAWGHQKRNVTKTGDVTSAGASWSPDGSVLAFARGTLQVSWSTPPFGSPIELQVIPTGGECDDPSEPPRPIFVDRFVAWSPDGTRIAVFDHADCQFDDRIDILFLGNSQLVQYAVSGADCCGYIRWTDLFWGPANQFGYTERNTGQFGEFPDAPTHIIYPGFASLDGDTEAAPSPSGLYLALTNTTTPKAKIIRANADGTARKVLVNGSQPDWQPRR
jgi:WD40-like Beta Propeller Repeat